MPRIALQAHLSFCLTLTAAFIGCATHIPRTEPAPIPGRSYVDLQPGWRIRTVTAILKSGGYKPDFREAVVAGGGVQLSAGDDFVGYETSYYAVVPGKDSGVAIAFVSSETRISGRISRQPEPLVRLFDFPGSSRYVRIIFLTRVSPADHNQAILAAGTLDDLNRLTQQVEADPAANCRSQGERHCAWVPEGIAVRPERRDPAHHKNWIPAT